MKRKPVLECLSGTAFGSLYQSKIGVLASNWLLQGMRAMSPYEVALKLLLDLLLTGLLVALSGQSVSTLLVLFALTVAHTLNWIFNGHFFVLLRYIRPVPQQPGDFERFIQAMARRAKARPHLDGISIYGSYCRGSLHEFSDLDVRFIVQPGFGSGVWGALYCLSERWRALFARFPLDIYCCVEGRGLEWLSETEQPVILLDRSGFLARRYPNGQTLSGVTEFNAQRN
jgi:hypothetical protein